MDQKNTENRAKKGKRQKFDHKRKFNEKQMKSQKIETELATLQALYDNVSVSSFER